jgi:hypothetical protein
LRKAQTGCSGYGFETITCQVKGDAMRTILIVILLLLLLGALPTWPYSTGWGYYPSGGFGLVLLIVVVVALLGRR